MVQIRILVFGLLFFIQPSVGYVSAQTQTQRSLNYAANEKLFSDLDYQGRLTLQALLTAAGIWSAVPNLEFNSRINAALNAAQARFASHPKGWAAGLIASTHGFFDASQFRMVRLPNENVAFGLPTGILSTRKANKYDGLSLEGRDMLVELLHFPQQSIESAYQVFLEKSSNVAVKILRPDFFVIVEERRGGYTYVRFHRYKAGIVGFHLIRSNKDWRDDPVQTLISGSLFITMKYGVSMFGEENSPSSLAPPSAAARQMPPLNATPAPATALPNPAPSVGSSGTGFFVSPDGHVVTNQHVVDGCQSIAVSKNSEPAIPAQLLAADKQNDLAVLSVATRPPKVLPLRLSPPIRLGESIAVFGFPLSTVLSRNGNFTLGNVTALAGINDDTRELQVSAAVQPGNSGGPMVDTNGSIVGVIASKLNALRTAARTGDIPQNVNFAIKASILASFLDANRITYSTDVGSAMQTVDLAEHLRLGSVFISCN